ncbi:MAG: BamA/TamA family outer membrane protein, partial [Myxococcota bacterium]|nr:BamA/TamA family outer membrane protein [Myxococcota bacterium]
ARVTGWRVEETRPATQSRPAVVEVVGFVEQGPPSLVTEVTWEDMEVIGRPLLALLDRSRPLREGDRFDYEDHQETQDLTVNYLQDQSFAHAKIDSRVDVDPERQDVRIQYRGIPGEPCTFGPVEITGLEHVPRSIVEDEISVVPGRAFKARHLAETQKRLFGLGVFSVVNVLPDLSDPTSDVVPVRIELSESRFRQLRLGGGFSFESGEQDVHLVTEFRHVNLFHRLWQLEVESTVGYTTLANFDDFFVLNDTAEAWAGTWEDGSPTALVDVQLDIPRFPAEKWHLENKLTFDRGLEPTYAYQSWEAAPTLSLRVSTPLTVSGAFHLKRLSYTDLPNELAELERAEIGSDLRYVLAYLEEQVTYDDRDDLLFTRRGVYAVADLAEAGLGGDFTFVRGQFDLRTYRQVVRLLGWTPRIILAGRAYGGLIVPLEDSEIPLAERFYLGGSSDVRGWTSQHLGPTVLDCAEGESCTSDDVVPIGGNAVVASGLEVRKYWPQGYGAAVFVDAGMVWTQLDEVVLNQVVPSVGVGGRYRSPVGPIRVDLAWPLRGSGDAFVYEPPVALHFALSEAF